ncbi:MAE_28990/MAE_18760 family HEPN-like nuclease [Lachnospiraceae bacterium 46-61]
MKIKNLNELEEKIDQELAWRKKELTSIRIDVEASEQKEKSEQSKAIRIGITMLYAHWEGAVKAIAEYYLVYVSGLHLKYGELKNNFLAITIKHSLNEFEETKKATIHNKLIDNIYLKKDEESQIPYKNVIKTESNLKMDIFKEIVATIGIDENPYMLKRMLIDQRLLGNRNKIAHGERLEMLDGIVVVSDYLELHTTVLELIEKFALNIKEAARNEDYKS